MRHKLCPDHCGDCVFINKHWSWGGFSEGFCQRFGEKSTTDPEANYQLRRLDECKKLYPHGFEIVPIAGN